ncbi:MAG: type II toxin-antitoxin system VapC family toxin [Bryobacteraceae bacterium]
MILLDTNVISELLKPQASGAVLLWLDAQPRSTVCLSVISQAELLRGVMHLPEGRRKREIGTAVEQMLATFQGRLLPFDESAARAYAEVVSDRRVAGRPIADFDAMIAAIARINDATLATRNIRDFRGCGIKLFDPWA